MRGSIENQVQQIWKKLDGIGESKYINRKNSEYKSQNSQNVSKLVHSFKYKDEIRRTATNLGNFAKIIFEINDMQQITDDIIISYFASKIDDECTYNTISTYISHIEKVYIALSEMEIKIEKHNKLFTRKSLVEARKNAKKFAIKKDKRNRAYINPKKIISLLPRECSLIAKLQLQYGLRIEEASKIKYSQINKSEKSLTYKGKGGYIMTKKLDIQILLELINCIKNSVNNGKEGFIMSYNNYAEQFKKAVEICGEEWNSTHGLRYNYAQNRFKFYLESNKTNDEALRLTSEDLGHHRKEITGRYL